MKARDATSMIEAAYRVEVPTDVWLQQLAASAVQALGTDLGALAFRYDASGGDWIHVGALGLHGLPPEFAKDFFDQADMPLDAGLDMVRVFTSIRVGSTREFVERNGLAKFAGVLDRYGVGDLVAINGIDPTGRGCMITIVDRRRSHSPRTLNLWHRLAAHVSAGNRLRAAVESLAKPSEDPTLRAEAIVTPDGKIEHATGAAQSRPAREALRDALVRIDQARAERDDAEHSVDLWRGLVAGRWSLVEHFERDGRRYFLAHKNDPVVASDSALSQREKQVLRYTELGHSNKLIAYELGLSASTVSTILARARNKLGTPT
jgi:DNA-binding CsgD family transcriptional regulator